MAFDLVVRQDDVAPCGRCNADSKRAFVERVDTLLRVPVWRALRLRRRCPSCGWTTYTPADPIIRRDLARPLGVTPRIVMTWLLFAAALCSGVPSAVWSHHLVHERALAPVVGDRWTIQTASWTAQTSDLQFENASKYGVVEVTRVSDLDVEVAGCNATTDTRGAALRHCRTFRTELAPVTRAAIPLLVRDHAIAEIARAGEDDLHTLTDVLLAGLLALFVLHGWRSHRMLTRRARDLELA